MKICIFGADGRTGVEVVRYAKQKGFDVVACVYSATAHTYLPNDITIKVGDVMNYDYVHDAIAGVDAVVSTLGHIAGSDPLMQTKGITNIVNAMKSVGIRRILSLTGTGARAKDDTPSVIDSVLNFFVKLIDPDRIHDGVQHVAVLQESQLDWTVVRVLKLGDSTRDVAKYTLTTGGPAELLTSRKKVAQVLVDFVTDRAYIGALPVVSG